MIPRELIIDLYATYKRKGFEKVILDNYSAKRDWNEIDFEIALRKDTAQMTSDIQIEINNIGKKFLAVS